MIVYKYPIRFTDKQSLVLPINAKLLTVQIQNNIPVIWALVNRQADLEEIKIFIYFTGQEITTFGEYLGTLQAHNLVYHVFYQR